jgi:hypothetical protein
VWPQQRDHVIHASLAAVLAREALRRGEWAGVRALKVAVLSVDDAADLTLSYLRLADRRLRACDVDPAAADDNSDLDEVQEAMRVLAAHTVKRVTLATRAQWAPVLQAWRQLYSAHAAKHALWRDVPALLLLPCAE